MNTGQMIITMAAMILLSTVILSVNKNALTTTTSMTENKYEILGVSLGTALLEEAFSKAFDENTTINDVTGEAQRATSKNDFSSSLGKDLHENYRKSFDDIDDYDGYVDSTSNATIDSTLSQIEKDQLRREDISAIFKVQSKVYYVDPSASSDLRKVNYRTWHKRMDVFVTSKFLNNEQDTIKLSKVYSYYYF